VIATCASTSRAETCPRWAICWPEPPAVTTVPFDPFTSKFAAEPATTVHGPPTSAVPQALATVRVNVSWATTCVPAGASGVTSIRSHVAGNTGAAPRDVEMIPTASPDDPVNHPAGTDCDPPRSVTAPVTPPDVTEYRAWTVAASGSTER
jgi:hypothetical protein